VVEELLAKEPGPPGEAVVLAGRAVTDAGAAGVTPGCRQWMMNALGSAMRRHDIPARLRAAAGRVLADLGDPRPEVMTVDGMEFCRVPAGAFPMGSTEDDELAWEAPGHEVDVPYDFFIGKYPVTVSQFWQYVVASQQEPGNPDSLRGALNAPVVQVSWHEAQGFCAWMTERWREVGSIERGWRIALSSEAEWEKAARGRGGRIYPWGDFADRKRANCEEIGIGEPSSVGCFPMGASPYGCEEMSGNVWEWTRSVHDAYPYPKPGKKRLHREDLSASGPRVLRGGSFVNLSKGMRCAARNGHLPSDRLGVIGFRVVLLPFSSDL
jgi:formylglycine-generating enzyme required for sulfatase activity